MEKMKFFVYGSLAEGQVHFSKFFHNSDIESNVYARGSIYRLEVGYPVFQTVGTQMVPGELVQCDAQDLLLNLLDEFHGYSRKTPEKSLYFREEIDVVANGGHLTKAYVYTINPAKLPRTAKLIDMGNWIEDLEKNPPCIQKLSEREKDYIRKLGQSSGRDIVPIQLDLYRQLMNMGVIVDKGRRLALTKFGQEIFRFLD